LLETHAYNASLSDRSIAVDALTTLALIAAGVAIWRSMIALERIARSVEQPAKQLPSNERPSG